MHYTRNKKLTYQINSSTTDTQRVPSINIPKLSNNNSIYIQNLIERSDRFKNLGSDYKVLSSCCPKLGSSIKNIFSSDKRRNDAMNYVKKLRSNKSQIMEFTESQAQNRQNSVSRFFNESPIRYNGVNFRNGSNQRTPIQFDIEGSSGKKFIDDNTYEDDNEIKQLYKRGETSKVIRFDDNNKYYYLNKSNSNNRLNVNNEFNYKVDHFEIGFDHSKKIRLRKETNAFSLYGKEKKKTEIKESTDSSTNTDSMNEEEREDVVLMKVTNKPMIIENKIHKRNIENDINKIKKIQKKYKEKQEPNEYENFTGYLIYEINKGRRIKKYLCDDDSINTINDVLKKDNVKICNKWLQFVDEEIPKAQEEKKVIHSRECQTEKVELVSNECNTNIIETKEFGFNVNIIEEVCDNGVNVNIVSDTIDDSSNTVLETKESGCNTTQEKNHIIAKNECIEIIQSKPEVKEIKEEAKEEIKEEVYEEVSNVNREEKTPIKDRAHYHNVKSIPQSSSNKKKFDIHPIIINDPSYEKITINMPLQNKCQKKSKVHFEDNKPLPPKKVLNEKIKNILKCLVRDEEQKEEEVSDIKKKITFAPSVVVSQDLRQSTDPDIKRVQTAPLASSEHSEMVSIINKKPTLHKKKKKPPMSEFKEDFSKAKEIESQEQVLIDAIKQKAFLFRQKFKKMKKEAESVNK